METKKHYTLERGEGSPEVNQSLSNEEKDTLKKNHTEMNPHQGWGVNPPQAVPLYQGNGMPGYFWGHMYQSPSTFASQPRVPYGMLPTPYGAIQIPYGMSPAPYDMMRDSYEGMPANYDMMRNDERFFVGPGFGFGWGWGYPYWGWGRPRWGWGRPGWHR